jgi:hypothetical protein
MAGTRGGAGIKKGPTAGPCLDRGHRILMWLLAAARTRDTVLHSAHLYQRSAVLAPPAQREHQRPCPPHLICPAPVACVPRESAFKGPNRETTRIHAAAVSSRPWHRRHTPLATNREADVRLINVMCISSKVPVSGTRSASILNIGHLRLRRGATILNNVTSAFASLPLTKAKRWRKNCNGCFSDVSPWGPYFSWYSSPAPQVAPGLLGVINQRAAAPLHRPESSALGCALWETRLVEKVGFVDCSLLELLQATC